MNENTIERVRRQIDIVELAGEQVQLQKSGRNFKANCPFHSEKTPSFYVYPERQTWHCFGACATGGDVFSYVMKRDGADFGEALRALAERAGVTIERGKLDNAPARDRLQAANEAAILFFRQALSGSAGGAEARAYIERRGLDDATVAAFELGYAPDGWDKLRGYLEGRGFSEAELLEAGLLSAGEQRGAYDRFRRRLIFPIRDDRGRAVGFGGRALDDAKPKYLNTPQTPLFDKSNLLFLLDRARDAIRAAGEAVVVEGYLDAITAHQFGYKNVVATLGTALTERHVQLLKRLTPRVTLAMDSDAAGLEAASRGEEVTRSIAAGDGRSEAVVGWDGLVRAQARSPVEIRVFTVPSGKDPDEAIREDSAGWPGWVQAAVSPFDFRLRLETGRTDLRDPRARVELADRMLPLLLQVGDRALQASYVEKLAGLAAINPSTLASRLEAMSKRKDAGAPLPLRERAGQPPAAPRTETIRDEKVEAFLLAVLLRHPALREAGVTLEAEIFERSVYRQIFSAWLNVADGLHEALAEDLRPAYLDVMALRLPPYDAPEAERALIDTAQKLRRRQLEEQKRLVTAELSEIQAGINQPSAVGLTLSLQRGDDRELDEAAEPVLAVASHLQEDEYLMRELHALEWEKRTHRAPRWAALEPAAEEPEREP